MRVKRDEEHRRTRPAVLAAWVSFSLLMGSIWMRRTYGVLLAATADQSFLRFFENKRSLFLKEVCVPSVIFLILAAVICRLTGSRGLIAGKLRNRLLLLCTAAMLAVAGLAAGVTPFVRHVIHSARPQWYDENRVVVHALGSIDGLAYTNSREALEKSYADGNKVFECDMILTADGKLVAAHDWDTGMQEGFSEENIPTRDVFMSTPIYGRYTPLSIEEIVLFMKEHPEVYFVTDTKSAEEEYYQAEFAQWVETAEGYSCRDILDRVIVQVYHPYMYGDIRKIYPFKNFVFTLYAEGYTGNAQEMEEYARFCRVNQIDVITMRADFYTDELNEICKRYQVELFVHTVNEQERKAYFLERGVGIYTD